MDHERAVDDALYDNYINLLVAIIAQARHDAAGGFIGGTTNAQAQRWRVDAREFLSWLYDDGPSPCATHKTNGHG